MAMMPGGTIGVMSEKSLVDLIDRRVAELVAGRIADYHNSDGFRRRVIEIVEPAIITTTGKLVENAESTLKQVKLPRCRP